MVGDILLFWYSWFKYRFIKLDLVTVRKVCVHFSRVLGSVVDCAMSIAARALRLKPDLRDAQNVCAPTKLGTVLKARQKLSILTQIRSHNRGQRP